MAITEVCEPILAGGKDAVPVRQCVFISKATPGDDEFVLWLAPRLEAAGYEVFADIKTLEPGTRWRKDITTTLQDRAVKMLLCCSDETLARDGVQEEIGIALDLSRNLGDPKFLIPLRIRPYRKLFGMGELQYIDFSDGWAGGLSKLLDALEKQNVPRQTAEIEIHPNWELYRRRDAVRVRHEPEPLTSNWLHIKEAPHVIRYYEPVGAIDDAAMKRACRTAPFPNEIHERGFFAFTDIVEVSEAFAGVGRLRLGYELGLADFIAEGLRDRKVRRREASNIVLSLFRQAWELMCRRRRLLEYGWSKHIGFHASDGEVQIGKKIAWGRQGQTRSSMLRNVAGGYVWQFGMSATPSLWPFAHFKLKSRVLFCEIANDDAGPVIDDKKKQHRLRRRICKGWRNKQWHGRMMAMLELLAGESPDLHLPLGNGYELIVDGFPVQFTSPVTTDLPNELTDEQEEADETTLTDEPSEEEAA